jgi:hypothetical protein
MGGDTSLVRYDGLYRAPSETKGFSSYLRFFPDGSAVVTTSSGSAQEVSRWLTKGWSAGDSQTTGRFRIYGDFIRIGIEITHGVNPPPNSTINCGGRIRGGRLCLRCESAPIEHVSEREYEFIQVEGLSDE